MSGLELLFDGLEAVGDMADLGENHNGQFPTPEFIFIMLMLIAFICWSQL